MEYNPKYQENDTVDYELKEKLSKMSNEELNELLREEEKKFRELIKSGKKLQLLKHLQFVGAFCVDKITDNKI